MKAKWDEIVMVIGGLLIVGSLAIKCTPEEKMAGLIGGAVIIFVGYYIRRTK